MMFKIATAATLLLMVTTALAQASSPAATAGGTSFMSQRKSLAGGSGMPSLAGNKTAGVQTPATLRPRVQDMEGTLTKMHAVLRQMRAKAASSSKDQFAKANLEMWELMVGHLDKQLQELRVAMAAREDLDARRAAMYKQADAKAEAAAQAARGLDTVKAPTPAPAAQATGQSAAGHIPAGAGEIPTPPASAPRSPN